MLELNIFTFVALPTVFDFHNLSIAQDIALALPVWRQFNAFCDTYYTSQVCKFLYFLNGTLCQCNG